MEDLFVTKIASDASREPSAITQAPSTPGVGLSRQDIERIMGLNQGTGPQQQGGTVTVNGQVYTLDQWIEAGRPGVGTAALDAKEAGATGPIVQNYTEPTGSESTIRSALAMNAQTLRKIQIAEQRNPRIGKLARMLFGQGGTTPQEFINTLQGFDKTARDYLMSEFAQEILLNSQASLAQGGSGIDTTGSGSGFNLGGALNPFGPTEGNRFQGLVDSIDQSVSNQISRVNETFKPVSTFLGETLGNLSRLTADPLGTIALIPSSIKNVIERNNSDFAARMEATYKKYNLDDLARLPSLIATNLGNLISDIDALISLPFIIISDLYLGLMDIINDVADAIQQIIANFLNKIFDEWLDGIFGEILAILQELSDLFGYIGGITTIFTGVTQYTQILFNVQTYIGQLGQFISNPLDLLFAYAPPQVSQALYLLRNPQQLVNNILPPQLSELFAKVSQITGFGFNGNMGYGFVSVLQGVQGGVIASILSNFANQYPILTSLLSLLNRDGMTAPNAEQPPIAKPSPVAPDNNKIKVTATGVPKTTQKQPDVVPESVIESDKAFLAETYKRDAMLANPVAFIRSVPEQTLTTPPRTPQIVPSAGTSSAGSSGSGVPSKPTPFATLTP